MLDQIVDRILDQLLMPIDIKISRCSVEGDLFRLVAQLKKLRITFEFLLFCKFKRLKTIKQHLIDREGAVARGIRRELGLRGLSLLSGGICCQIDRRQHRAPGGALSGDGGLEAVPLSCDTGIIKDRFAKRI